MKNHVKSLLVLSTLMILSGCNGTEVQESSSSSDVASSSSSIKESSSSSIESSSQESSSTAAEQVVYERKKQEMPTAEIIDDVFDYGDPTSWPGTNSKSVSLGKVYLQDVIDDDVYDWGHTVIKEGDTYKMWWVRPALYDAIFYAESKDLKNFTNVQRVISFSNNNNKLIKYDNIKGMLGKPSVLHVNNKYYMYFEAPASEDPDVTQTVLEWDNQVMLATSTDGINWELYSNESNQPQPVVAMESNMMHNTNLKDYGCGQPSAFYKDGTFYLTYCNVLTASGGRKNGMYVATSTDGIHFNSPSEHQYVAPGNGCGFTYNTKTNKYMMSSSGSYRVANSLNFESGNYTEYSYCTYDSTKIQRGFPEFIKNEHGLVDTETFYMIALQGDRSTTDDWRAGYKSWDGAIHAVNPVEYGNREITLPNGAAATTNNLKGYKDRKNSYSRPSADAIYAEDKNIKIDCEKDAAYDKATKIEVTRPIYTYGSNFTTSYAEAYLAWNETYLYAYVQVYDQTPDTSAVILYDTQTYLHDSFDIFLDCPNDHGENENVSYGLEQYMICTDSDNTHFCIKGAGEYELTDEFTGIRHRAVKKDYGYVIELRIPWHELVTDYIYENACIGADFQVNDAVANDKTGREAMLAWSNHHGESFRYTDGMGDIYLIKG